MIELSRTAGRLAETLGMEWLLLEMIETVGIA